jgi:Spy/CpxP family protein refolding chaperone
MTWKKSSIGISALAIGLLATLAASTAGAVGGHCKHGGRGGFGGPPDLAQLEHRLEKLDLSADVRAKAFALLDASRGEERALREKTRAAHEKLRAALKSGTPNVKALDAQVDELGALRTQQHKQFLHTLIKVGALLPDAERAKWFEPRHRDRHQGDRPH